MRRLLALGLLLTSAPAAAQMAPAGELAAVREATELEAAGNLQGAVDKLDAVLDENPASLAALVHLERVLAMQGRTEDLVPHLDRLLADDRTSVIAHQMRVRAFAALDREEEIERAAREWIDATPKIEIPYREIARVWQQRGRLDRAAKVLEDGRRKLGRNDALALELGDVRAAAGDFEGAVREWNRAIAEDGQGFLLVQRRLQSLPDGGAPLIPRLVEALGADGNSVARREAAAQLALGAGLGEAAERIARALAPDLDPRLRGSFIVEVARRADGAGLYPLARWAYAELLKGEEPGSRLLAIRTRLAELALLAGDTAAAASAYADLEDAYAAGSPQRREALAVRVQLAAREGSLEQALRFLDDMRKEFPEGADTDAAAAAVAVAALDADRTDIAERALTGVSGPRTSLARGRLFLGRGEIPRARDELFTAAAGLHGAEATSAIALASLVARVSPQGGELVTTLLTAAGEVERSDVVRAMIEATVSLDAGERAAILDFAAGVADRDGLVEEAAELRREIVEHHPRSAAAPAAMLELARVLDEPGQLAEARLLLERVILEHPRSPLVPQARRQLDRIADRIPADTASHSSQQRQ